MTQTMEQLAPCGTYAAYQRHVKKRETPCPSCTEASRVYINEWRANRRLSQELDRFAASITNKTPLRPDPTLYELLAEDRDQYPYKGKRVAK